MLTRTGEYALRALIHLVQHEQHWPITGSEIARHAGIPAKYLSTILSALVRVGVLESARGKSGGFRMVRSSKKTFLYDILEPFEPLLDKRRPCPFGASECSDEDPCLGHDAWKRVRETYYAYLRKTSIFDVAIGKRRKGGGVRIKLKS